MRKMLTSLTLAAGLLLAGATLAMAEPPPATDPKQAADEAKKQAEADAQKQIQEAIAKAAQTGQPAPPTPGPMAIPVPENLPVLNKIELPDGLVAEELKIGEGYEVKPGGLIVAHYHGTLKEGGKVFDSSFNRGTPALIPLDRFIPGLQKGIPGMKIGGIRRVIVPAKLAYGDKGAGNDIPPNSDLVFIIRIEDALQTTDTRIGEGEEVGPQPVVCVTSYTMKDANGKEVASATKEKPYIWIPNEMMGVSAGMEGMKVGGKRTIKVPAQMNQSDPRIAGDRPQQVPVTVDVELLAVRNLATPPARTLPKDSK